MALRSQAGQPERIPFFIPRDNKLISSMARRRDCRLTRREAPAWAGQAPGGREAWTWNRVGLCSSWAMRKRAGHEYGPPSGRDARIRGRPIGSHSLVLGSCGSSAVGLANEVLYNTRTPYTDGPTRSDTVGQGRALRSPRKGNFAVVVIWWVLPVGTVRGWSRASNLRRTDVQTYNAVGPPVSQSVISHFLLAQRDAKRKACVRSSHTIPFLTLVFNLVSQLLLAAPPSSLSPTTTASADKHRTALNANV